MFNPFLPSSISQSSALNIFGQPSNDKQVHKNTDISSLVSNSKSQQAKASSLDAINSQTTQNIFQVESKSKTNFNSLFEKPFFQTNQKKTDIFSIGQKEASESKDLFPKSRKTIEQKKNQKKQTNLFNQNNSSPHFDSQSTQVFSSLKPKILDNQKPSIFFDKNQGTNKELLKKKQDSSIDNQSSLFRQNNIPPFFETTQNFNLSSAEESQQKTANIFQAIKEQSLQQTKRSERTGKPNLTIQIQQQRKEIKKQLKRNSNIANQLDEKITNFFESINIINNDSEQQKRLDQGLDDMYQQRKKNQEERKTLIELKKEQLKKQIKNSEINHEKYRQTLGKKWKQRELELEYKIRNRRQQTKMLQSQKQEVSRQLEKLSKQLKEYGQIKVKSQKPQQAEELKSPKFREYPNLNLIGNNKELIQADEKFNALQYQVKKFTKEIQQKKKARDNLKKEIQKLQSHKAFVRRESAHKTTQQLTQQLTDFNEKYKKYYQMYQKIRNELKNKSGIRQLSKGTSNICFQSGIHQEFNSETK